MYEPAGPSGDANAYVHHDIMLPAFPLCLAWVDCHPSGAAEPANLAAVGLMTPGIELWDLNDVSAVEPVAVLGGEAAAPAADIEPEMGRAEKKKAKKKAREVGLPVLCLAELSECWRGAAHLACLLG